MDLAMPVTSRPTFTLLIAAGGFEVGAAWHAVDGIPMLTAANIVRAVFIDVMPQSPWLVNLKYTLTILEI
jgi:hypothetical protein